MTEEKPSVLRSAVAFVQLTFWFTVLNVEWAVVNMVERYKVRKGERNGE